jgi:hypothetical protein
MIFFNLDIAHHEEDGESEFEVFLYPKGCIIHTIDVVMLD